MAEDELEIEIDLGDVLTPPSPIPPSEARPAAVALPPRFAQLVDGIEPARLRNLITQIYARHLKALGTLGAIERILKESGVTEVARLFDVLRNQCANLLAYVTEAVASADFLNEDVKDTLDGMRFVVAHEMSKVFRMDFRALTGATGAPYSRSELTRAWGLMNNCLQQTAITLAQAFDPAASGERLFEDYQDKVENSLALYRDLNLLVQKVKRARKANGILLKHSLIRHLELFRDETMHFLMYKDWAEFESFVEKVKDAFEEIESFDKVLNEFAPYLDTLIHHVGMREVLRHVGAARPQGGPVPQRLASAGAGRPAI
ncbi:MAG TPA: hypothetical protein VEX60_04960 [Pyrinomonadaceae bacterium]|nr:hypothetical protein [Pyrinomonadaceae bacterium]